MDVVTELFKDSIINVTTKVQENGQLYNWLMISAEFPLNELHRHEIFLNQIDLCKEFSWLSHTAIERNNRDNKLIVQYEIGIGSMDEFLKLATEKLAWSAYSKNFDEVVEKELSKKTE